ncbi:MAG: hypothetical protein KUG82_01135 [Pseudomonadales bacterium]|nr:hypothetical protein [Pseudomonadales bacterium]
MSKQATIPCLECEEVSSSVPYKTILHHLQSPLNFQLETGDFYFCSSPKCIVTYFDQVGHTFRTDNMRDEVGQKSSAHDRTICYCFDITANQIETELKDQGTSISKEKVIHLTRAKLCACDIRNPAGSCCLSAFIKFEKQYKKESDNL